MCNDHVEALAQPHNWQIDKTVIVAVVFLPDYAKNILID